MRRLLVGLMLIVLAISACSGVDGQPQVRVVTATVPNYPSASAPMTPTSGVIITTITPTASGNVIIPDGNCGVPTGWQGYIVAPGDALSVIAESIGSTVAIIQQGNCLSNSDAIFVGQLLYLPSLPANAPLVTQAVATTVINPPANCAIPSGWMAYQVVAGDTLGTIATASNSTVATLQSANCIQNTEIIYVGQILYVPSLPVGVPTANVIATVVRTNTPNAATCPIPTGWQSYIVQSGDTLNVIATRFNTTAAVLQSGNCLSNANNIQLGQLLYVPSQNILATATRSSTTSPLTTATVAATSGPIGIPPTFSQNLVIRPTIQRVDGVLVTMQATVALDIGVVADADRVDYMVGTSPSLNDPNWVVAYTDNDPYDGTRGEYTFNDFDAELYFRAVARNEFGLRSSVVVRVVYDPTFSVGSGTPDIFPFLGFDGSIYTLESGRTVTVTWGDAPSNAMRVEFRLVQASTGDTLINTDNNLGDGAKVLWIVPQTLRGQVYARAFFSNGTHADSAMINVYSED